MRVSNSNKHPAASLHLLATTARRGAETAGIQIAAALSARQPTQTRALSRSTASYPHPVETIGSGENWTRAIPHLRARSASVDVVVAHGSATLPACAIGLAGTGVPFVYRSIGDPNWWVGDSRFRRFRTSMLLKRASRVVVLWPEAADTMHARFGVERDRIDVIPNAVPVDEFCSAIPDRLVARDSLGIPRDAAVVAYVGNLSDEKNPGPLLDAVLLHPALRLLVAGDGPLRRVVIDAAKKSEGRIKWVGVVPDVRPLLAASDVLGLTSLTEGIPAVVIEAGLAGIPTVATPVGGLPTVIENNVTGFFVQHETSGQHLAEVLTTAIAQKDELGNAARARYAARFDLAHVVDLWENAIRTATER